MHKEVVIDNEPQNILVDHEKTSKLKRFYQIMWTFSRYLWSQETSAEVGSC